MSKRRTLKILISPQPGTGFLPVMAETLGDNAKVTKPLSSIFSTRAPKTKPAVVRVGLQVIMLLVPEAFAELEGSYWVITLVPTRTTPSLARRRPIGESIL